MHEESNKYNEDFFKGTHWETIACIFTVSTTVNNRDNIVITRTLSSPEKNYFKGAEDTVYDLSEAPTLSQPPNQRGPITSTQIDGDDANRIEFQMSGIQTSNRKKYKFISKEADYNIPALAEKFPILDFFGFDETGKLVRDETETGSMLYNVNSREYVERELGIMKKSKMKKGETAAELNDENDDLFRGKGFMRQRHHIYMLVELPSNTIQAVYNEKLPLVRDGTLERVKKYHRVVEIWFKEDTADTSVKYRSTGKFLIMFVLVSFL